MTGRFLGYLPRYYAAPLVERGELRQLLGVASGYQSSVAAVVKSGVQQSRPVKRLLAALQEACSGQPLARLETGVARGDGAAPCPSGR